MAYRWRPIEDLPEDYLSLTDRELEPLLEVWKEQQERLCAEGLLDKFNQQMQRRWAIETGIIENVYSLDRGTTEILIERGIDARLIPRESTNKDPELVAAIIQDHSDVLEGVFAFVRGERPLSTGYIKELHAALLRHQSTTIVHDQFGNLMEVEVEKGEYKKLPNNPRRPDGEMHEYCPPEHVASEMDRLVQAHHEHSSKGVPPEIEAAWLHHRFTQIHPFTDGNGRVARALASLVFLKAGWSSVVVPSEDKPRYIDALEVADWGNLRPLIDFFVRTQRYAYIELLKARDTVSPPATVGAAINSVREFLQRRHAISNSHLETVRTTTLLLAVSANSALIDTGSRLENELADFVKVVFYTDAIGSGLLKAESLARPNTSLLYAKHLPALKIEEPAPAVIVLSFHQLGRLFHGLMLAQLSLVMDSTVTVGDPFQINYREAFGQTQVRFKAWLEKNLAQAILLWREQL